MIDAFEQAVVDEAGRLEALLTVFDPNSALHAFRRHGSSSVAELNTVIELAIGWWHKTEGAFHPAVQPLIDVWDLAEKAGTAPTAEQLANTAAELQSETVLSAMSSRAALNLNAIAKGWIVERSLRSAFEMVPEASAAWLSLGGDVVHRGSGSVTVGIENPARPYDNVAPLAEVELSNEALATSGGARRWWTIGDRRYPKVLDPRSGYPVDRLASATIVAPDGASADALATAAIVQRPEETLALVERLGADCFLIDADGAVVSSSDRFRPLPAR